MLNALSSQFRSSPKLGALMSPDDNSFGVLRLAMASAVLISHSVMFHRGTSAAEPLHALTGRSLGEYGVQVFFILSGLMVAHSLSRARGLVDFVTARVLRIFPALIVCVLLTALLLGPLVSRFDLVTYFTHSSLFNYIAKTVTLATGAAPLPGVFENNPLPSRVNTSLWTLKYEVICYTLLGVIGMLGALKPNNARIVAPLLAGFIALVFVVSPQDHTAYAFMDTVRYFTVFFATGILFFVIRDQLPVFWGAIPALFAVFVVALDTRFAEPASALFLGYTALWLSTLTFGPLRAFCNRYDLSFGIYIFAGPIQQALIEAWPQLSSGRVTLLAFLIVVPLAFASWLIVERPAMLSRPRVATWINEVLSWRPKRQAVRHEMAAEQRPADRTRLQARVARLRMS